MSRDSAHAWLTRDTLITGGALALASALAWRWLATTETGMEGMAMDGMTMAGTQSMPWTPTYAISVFVMWSIMMVAMMLPAAAPMILLYNRVARGSTVVFAGAYVAVWTAFSALAATAQWGLTEIGLVGDAMRLADRPVGGVLFVAAGLYQLTPLKRICLANCRSPLAFLALHWRPGFRGALSMGLRHGAYCVGCCWFVMGLLFVGGVMNLTWVVAIAAFVLAEKVLPFGERVGMAAGAIALAAGAYFIAAPFVG